jgi:hypothetical protein
MELKTIEQIIARRELDLTTGGKVTIIVGKPEQFPDGIDFYCPYQITGLSNSRIRYAGGIDEIQALSLTLSKIGADLYTSDAYQSGTLMWNGLKNLGFPVPHSIKDLVPLD